MSYGPDEIEPHKRAALMVNKILKDAKPADLPVEQPTKFALQINLKTAKALGLTVVKNETHPIQAIDLRVSHPSKNFDISPAPAI